MGWTLVRFMTDAVRSCANAPANVDANLRFGNPILIVFLVPQLGERIFTNEVGALCRVRNLRFVDLQILWEELILLR